MFVEAVLLGETLSTKEFCGVLINEVKIGHARLHHPFYLALYDGKLSLDEIRVWAKEAWGIFAYNVAINTAKLVRCQLSGIHDPQIHKKFVEIIQSEVATNISRGHRGGYPGIEPFFFASVKASASRPPSWSAVTGKIPKRVEHLVGHCRWGGEAVREAEEIGVMECWSSGVMGNSKNEAMKQRLLEYWRAEE